MTLAATTSMSALAADEPLKMEKVHTSETWMAMVDPWFVMVYHLGDFEECDKRPTHDPFTPGGEEKLPTPRFLSQGSELLDVAAVIAATKKRIKISKEQFASLMEAVLDSNIEAFVADFYDPHHLVVCYDEFGAPKAAVEICFGCNQIRISPGHHLIASNRYDMVALARMFVSWGLPLGGKEERSLKDYEHRDREWRKRQDERARKDKQ